MKRFLLVFSVILALVAGQDECIPQTDQDGDGHTADEDCNDLDASIYPGAPELCDGLDNDCDDEVDEGLPQFTYYRDADGDGFGDEATPFGACSVPEGLVDKAGDCDDADGTTYPNAEELCDGVDNDCDEEIDEGVKDVYYYDGDQDGYGLAGTVLLACSPPSSQWVEVGTDCNDTNASIHPGAVEPCNGTDDDCDGQVDEGVTRAYYPDQDQDGYGTSEGVFVGCAPPDQTNHYVTRAGDCDDQYAGTYPGADDVCDERDNDCDGKVDNGDGAVTWYLDFDNDGYGNDGSTLEACERPAGYSKEAGDCDDEDPGSHPGAAEQCGDSIDNDCDGIGGVELRIPDEYDTFAAAIDDAHDGDLLCVSPGTYVDYLNFNGLAIHVLGVGGPEETIIEGDGERTYVVQFMSGEQRTSRLEGFTVREGVAANQGGMEIKLGSSPSIRNVVITDTSATDGGGIYVGSGCAPLLEDVIVSETSAQSNGGGVYVAGSPVIDNLTIRNTLAGYGGGMYINGSPVISSMTVEGSRATYDGGGVYLTYTGNSTDYSLVLSNTVISGCSSSGWYGGGGLYASSNALGPRFVFKDVVVQGNRSNSADGGGMLINTFSAAYSTSLFVDLMNVIFSDNTSLGSGGGLALWTSTGGTQMSVAMRNVILSGNSSGAYGGGIYANASGGGNYNSYVTLSVVNASVTANSSGSGGGVGLVSGYRGYFSSVGFTNVDFSYNDAVSYGGGIYTSGNVGLRYCNARYNEPNDFSGPVTQTGLLGVAPFYLDVSAEEASEWDLHLSLLPEPSALIDAGDPEIPDVDGSRSDIGAFGGPCSVGADLNGDGVLDCPGWDLDADSYPNYYWPGYLADAPEGAKIDDYDVDDCDPTVH